MSRENATTHGRVSVSPWYPDLNRKVAIVTGGAGGIGETFVTGLAEQGVNVIASDVKAAHVYPTPERRCVEFGVINYVQADVSKEEENQKLVDQAMEQYGRVDFFVGAAGTYPEGTALDLPHTQLRKTLEVNVEGIFLGARAAARAMTSGGAIVMLSSINASKARENRSAYSISKAAVAHIARSMAIEFGKLGIRVNSIAPGFIDTPMTEWIKKEPIALERALNRLPISRMGSPVDVLGGLLFLLSDTSSYVTGHNLAIDAGAEII